MALNSASDDFYRSVPPFRDFRLVADEFSFSPLPEDWLIGVADVEQSTKAIQGNRYKAVNMAGAAVIAAIANASVGEIFLLYLVATGRALLFLPPTQGLPGKLLPKPRPGSARISTWH